MRQVHAAELRHSWAAWASVALGFVLINFALVLCGLILGTGLQAVETGVLTLQESVPFVWTPGFNILLVSIVGASAIGSATSLVVDSRRGSLARLALAGATPRQVRSTVMTQLTVTSLVCALLGTLAAAAFLPAAIAMLTAERGADELSQAPDPVWDWWAFLIGPVVAVAIALVGGYQQARRASGIAPVEALRQAAAPDTGRMTLLRWVGVGLLVLVVGACVAALVPLAAYRNKETISNIFLIALFLLLLIGTLLAVLAPVLVRPLTRAWTALLPIRAAPWQLARLTVAAKSDRMVKSVVPVMFAVGILVGMVGIAGSLNSTLAANGFDVTVEHVGALSFLTMLGLPLVIAVGAGLGSLIMMSRQREAELALVGVVGGTPGQRVATPILEGVIIAVTATLLGLLMAGGAVGYLLLGFVSTGMRSGFAVPWVELVVVFASCLAVTVAATVLPTVRSLREPEPKVIARLVAD